MYTLYGKKGSGSASTEIALDIIGAPYRIVETASWERAVVSKWSGSPAHLQQARPAFHETLLRIETHPKVAPVFARHWPPA